MILQLINLPPAETPDGKRQEQREFGEFLHVDGRRYYDFQEIRKEIEAETIRVTGMNKAISKLPSALRAPSDRAETCSPAQALLGACAEPHARRLARSDQDPGVRAESISLADRRSGDQPSDIEKQIRTLVTDYISKPNWCVGLSCAD